MFESPDSNLISHSQVNVWNTCEFSWWLSYDQKWTLREDKSYFATGGMVHELLACFYTAKKNGAPNHEALQEVMQLISQKIAEGTPIELVNQCGWLARRYILDFATFEDTDLKILEVEKHLSVDLVTPKGRDFTLHGIIDLVVEKAGKVWIWDHKTSSNAKFWSEYKVLMDPQMPTYCAILRRHGIEVFGIMFNFLNTYEYKDKEGTSPDKLFKRHPTYRSEYELDTIEREFGFAVDDIIDRRESGGPYRRSMGAHCEKCFFQDPCLLNMKGMRLEEVITGAFRQKGQEENLVVPSGDLDFPSF